MKQVLSKIINGDLAFTTMFDFVKDLVFLMEVRGSSYHYIYVNQSAFKVLKSDDSIYGRKLEDVLSLEQYMVLAPKYDQVQSTLKSVEFIEESSVSDKVTFGETSLNPIVTEEGDCRYILAIVRDVTEIKQEEQKTRAKEKRLDSLVKYNREAVFEFDLDGRFVSVNDRAMEISGYEYDEFIGQSFKPIVVKKYLADAVKLFEKALSGTSAEYEIAIHHKKGHQVYLLINKIPIIVDDMLVGIYGIAKDITKQKKLEYLLQESEQRYKSLFENHPDAIFTYDTKGHFISGNAEVENLSGYTRAELLGKSIESLIEPVDVDRALNYFKKAVTGKKSQRYETSGRNKNGSRLDLSVTKIPIVVNNDVVGIYGVTKDITSEKRLQKELIEKTEELEAFWNNSVDPIFLANNNLDIVQCNPAFERLFNYKIEELPGLKNERIPFELGEEMEEIITECIGNGKNILLKETKRRTKNGDLLDILASYTPALDKDEKVTGVYGFYKNVTHLKTIERELKKTQEKFQLITENAFDVITLTDFSGLITYVSPSNEMILGYKYEDYINYSYRNFIHPDDQETFGKRLEAMKIEDHLSTVEIRMRHKKGHYIWMDISTSTILEDGQTKKAVMIARDATERKDLQNQLENAAYYDYLSGLPNRRVFDDKLNQAIIQANRLNKKVAILMLDGQGFKQINDTYGHDAGDAVIKEMARRLESSVEKNATVTRRGGDEMAVIISDIEFLKEAEDTAKCIIQALNEPFYFNGINIQIGAGIGISLYPDDTDDKKRLVTYADRALYQAKEAGGSRYRLYQNNSVERGRD